MTPISMRFLAFASVLTTTAGAASAQALCAGAGEGGQWIGGSEGASDIATADVYREQMALVLAGNQYVSLFSLSDPASVRIEAAGRGAGDPLIDVIDASGNIIASDDDSGGEGASRAELDLDAGTYCVAVSSYDGAPMTAFVRVGTTDQEPLTAGTGQTSTTGVMTTGDDTDGDGTMTGGGSCETAADLGSLGDISLSASGSADETPYYRFTLDTTQAVTVRAENEVADPIITLLDEAEGFIAENDDFDGLNSQIDVADPLAPGTYCIQVGALSDTAAPIDVSVSIYDAEAALQDLYASGETPPPMDGSVPITDLGTLQNRLREDAMISGEASWFSIAIDSPGLVIMEAIDGSGSGDPFVRVFDDLGRLVTLNDDYGEGYDSLVAIRASAGTYLISVVQVDDVSSALTRMVFEKFQPAQ